MIVVHVDVREGLILLNFPVFGRWEDFIQAEQQDRFWLPQMEADRQQVTIPQAKAA